MSSVRTCENTNTRTPSCASWRTSGQAQPSVVMRCVWQGASPDGVAARPPCGCPAKPSPEASQRNRKSRLARRSERNLFNLRGNVGLSAADAPDASIARLPWWPVVGLVAAGAARSSGRHWNAPRGLDLRLVGHSGRTATSPARPMIDADATGPARAVGGWRAPQLMKTAPAVAALATRSDRMTTRSSTRPALQRARWPRSSWSSRASGIRIPCSGSGSHAAQTARVMPALEPILERERSDVLLVPGRELSGRRSAHRRERRDAVTARGLAGGGYLLVTLHRPARPMTCELGTNTLLGLNPGRIVEVPALIEASRGRAATPPPGWNGAAGERVVKTLDAGVPEGDEPWFITRNAVSGGTV